MLEQREAVACLSGAVEDLKRQAKRDNISTGNYWPGPTRVLEGEPPPQPDRVSEPAPDELAPRRAARGGAAAADARSEVMDRAAAHEAEPGEEAAEQKFREILADTFSEEDDPDFEP